MNHMFLCEIYMYNINRTFTLYVRVIIPDLITIFEKVKGITFTFNWTVK